jgi:hypothetical protein
MAYFANVGTSSGPLRHRVAPATADVLESRDGASVGVATLVGRGPTDIALWRLVVQGIELDGLFIISGNRFRPEQ